jgi:CRISPR-associated protein Cas2
MSRRDLGTWLVAYDIADPRRLRRVYKTVRREGASVQYSAYSVTTDSDGIDDLMQRVNGLLKKASDDVRAYHLPDRCHIWTLGRQGLPEGVEVDADTAARLLLDRRCAEEGDMEDLSAVLDD